MQETPVESSVATAILDPVIRRTALVKLQGPFTDRQLESIAKGMVYLEKLGLTSVIVIELDDWVKGEQGDKSRAVDEVMRVVSTLEKQGARARPVLQSVVRLGPDAGETDRNVEKDVPSHGSRGDLGVPHTRVDVEVPSHVADGGEVINVFSQKVEGVALVVGVDVKESNWPSL